ncbi:Polymorphic membrane protein chlamydia [Saccharothrix espanaensis DSM 44229]|uniref:Polymorphic membrane protein chlamydia n=2 Tax=Saccharothrix espanaensis TaxID=103731 RepID=K0JQN9_SACES|nr:Polymorphic membrane protein chlamydia [Saccharothrix espanaensis DSM 44229]
MSRRWVPWVAVLTVVLAACGTSSSPAAAPSSTVPTVTTSTTTATTTTMTTTTTTTTTVTRAKPAPAGNPGGTAVVPEEAGPEDVREPTTVVGTGTPAGCTSQAVVAAVAAGGVITFDCGPEPVTITMAATARVRNDGPREVVIDGGGLVTLSGGGQRRILYQNTCDAALGITTSHCQDQDHPRLSLQNLTFADGDATGDTVEGGGGGAVFVRGGRVKVVDSRFRGNRCDQTGPDLGGAAMRVLGQHGGRPVYVTGSTFSGGVCANGGALSSIGVSWVILNSVLSGNSAVGRGANPARAGTPGGGSGGAVYVDGNRFTVRIAGSVVEDNRANEGGGAVFFVSNDRSGTLAVESSALRRNPSAGFETPGYKGIFFLGAADPTVSGSTIQ